MQIMTKQITKILLSEIDRLDPVTVILDDIAPGQGRIIIECYGNAWAAYWGGMGEGTVSQFFCSCNNGYLIANLARGKERLTRTVTDYDKINEDAEASNLNTMEEYCIDHETLQELYGEDWMHGGLPEMPNSEYYYLSRIIDAVKEGLSTKVNQSSGKHDG